MFEQFHAGVFADQFGFTPPSISWDILKAHLLDEYGIEGEMKALHGERDQNVRVVVNEDEQYVIKIAGHQEAPELIDFQLQTLEHVRKTAPMVPVPRHFATSSGDFVSTLHNKDGLLHRVRLLTYLPGTPLSMLQTPSYQTLRNIGMSVGELSQALSAFSYSGESHFMPWNSLNGLVMQNDFRKACLPRSFETACTVHRALPEVGKYGNACFDGTAFSGYSQ